jgi:hypothetical protein
MKLKPPPKRPRKLPKGFRDTKPVSHETYLEWLQKAEQAEKAKVHA